MSTATISTSPAYAADLGQGDRILYQGRTFTVETARFCAGRVDLTLRIGAPGSAHPVYVWLDQIGGSTVLDMVSPFAA